MFSPHQDITSERIEVLHRLPSLTSGILVTPVSTLMQRLAPQSHIDGNSFVLKVGQRFDMESTRLRLVAAGYRQRDNVFEHGEFAVRGAIMDIFPMGEEQPFRIESFDDEIESLRLFDADTQRSSDTVDEIMLLPAAEFPLSSEGISHFRTAFRDRFDVDHRQCTLYQDVSEGLASGGLEYYLPLFFDRMASLFDYLPDSTRIVQMAGCEEAASHFWEEAGQRYESRRHDIRRPILSPLEIFLRPDELNGALKSRPRARLHDSDGIPFPFTALPDFSVEAHSDHNPFERVKLFAS